MNVYIETHGCKLNIADSQKISKGILSKGFSISDDLEKSDIYILNTCTVTKSAAMQSYAEQLSEVDIAAVITYTRKAWGNDASGDGEIVIPKEILDYKNNKL